MISWNSSIKYELEEIENKKDIKVFYFPTTINFLTIDGYINYTIVVINYILEYGKRNAQANSYLRQIRGRLSKISSENVVYQEGKDFGDYKSEVSKVFEGKINKTRIKENKGYFGTVDDNTEEKRLIIMRYKDIMGKELESTPKFENFEEYVDYFMLTQLDKTRLSKETKSQQLSKYGCHIEIIIALNYLINAADYLCRCLGSYQKEGLFYSDKMEIETLIKLSEVTVKRIPKITCW